MKKIYLKYFDKRKSLLDYYYSEFWGGLDEKTYKYFEQNGKFSESFYSNDRPLC